ncbi:MAG: type I-E CRISPR-associated protein Cas5/CasD [Syntrophales bacterium]|jgi:CRISPR system Cascade subunit CasD|nr:type I-E CRISPR-associated protein Cas5/CasD [Syntrophales bacterium]
MTEYLLFRLYGPLAAWGDIAVGEYRPSFAHPSKSAIIGLLAAALGIRRDEEEKQKLLAESCKFAVRVDSTGVLLRDYHTTQVPSAQRGVTHYTRRSELEESDLNTILSSRDYRCDAVYTIAITMVDGSPFPLQQLASALKRPVFTLYLGRKSCPLSLPLHPQTVKAETLKEALLTMPIPDELTIIIPRGDVNVFWENEVASGVELQQTITRRDEPRSRRRWQFADRRENRGALRKEG